MAGDFQISVSMILGHRFHEGFTCLIAVTVNIFKKLISYFLIYKLK